MEEREEWPLAQVSEILPPALRAGLAALSPTERREVEELRLRVGQPLAAVLPAGERGLGGHAVGSEDLEQLLELASRASVHRVLGQLRHGYVTVRGGHRVGFCGTVAGESGALRGLGQLSSAAVRLARSVPGVCRSAVGELGGPGTVCSTLILAPPGLGKTTFLRDLIRCVSRGEGFQPQRVGVADERGELAALWQGRPQLDVGPRTDVMEGCGKAQGLMMLLRGMNPQVLAVDEITAPEDVQALLCAAGCGVTLLATAHGFSPEDLKKRPVYRELLEEGIFQRLVTIGRRADGRSYRVEEMPECYE